MATYLTRGNRRHGGGRTTLRLLTVFLTISAVSLRGQTPADEISGVYSREAYSIVEEAPEEAYELAGIALEFNDANADAYHVRGVIDAREQETRGRAAERLEEALDLGGFSVTSERDARLLLSQLLIDSRRYDQALAVLEPLLEARRFDQDALFLEIRAERLRGRGDTAMELAEEADRVYSDDPRFFGELVRLEENPGADMLRRLETRPFPDNEHWLSTVRYFAANATGDDAKASAVDLYLEHGGSDPAIYIYAESLEEDERVESFLEAGGGEDLLLVQQMYERVSEEGRAVLEQEFSGFTGTLEVDRRRRGLAEESLRFSDGNLREWRIDTSVDGRPEWILRFDDRASPEGDPGLEEIVGNMDGSRTTVRYVRYPEVEYMDFGTERFYFTPQSLMYPVLEGESEWPDGELNVFFDYGVEQPAERRLSDEPPEQSSVIDDAYLLQEFEDGQVVRSARLRQGVRVLESSDTLGDGLVDRVSYFEEGIMRYTLEDPRGVGAFEVFREYAQGELSWTGYDTNRDGNYDFIESYEDGRLAEWDYDDDGVVDVRHYDFVDGSTRTQFLRFLSRPVEIRIDRVWTQPNPSSRR